MQPLLAGIIIGMLTGVAVAIALIGATSHFLVHRWHRQGRLTRVPSTAGQSVDSVTQHGGGEGVVPAAATPGTGRTDPGPDGPDWHEIA